MPSPVRYADLSRWLRRRGWQLLRVKGSHHNWFKPGVGVFPIPVHQGLVKHGYVKELQEIEGAKFE
jgi:predicted RNA binding protein YcfA (HicA-like mRNA interferase family)